MGSPQEGFLNGFHGSPVFNSKDTNNFSFFQNSSGKKCKFSHKMDKFLHISKKCCIFAANFVIRYDKT